MDQKIRAKFKTTSGEVLRQTQLGRPDSIQKLKEHARESGLKISSADIEDMVAFGAHLAELLQKSSDPSAELQIAETATWDAAQKRFVSQGPTTVSYRIPTDAVAARALGWYFMAQAADQALAQQKLNGERADPVPIPPKLKLAVRDSSGNIAAFLDKCRAKDADGRIRIANMPRNRPMTFERGENGKLTIKFGKSQFGASIALPFPTPNDYQMEAWRQRVEESFSKIKDEQRMGADEKTAQLNDLGEEMEMILREEENAPHDVKQETHRMLAELCQLHPTFVEQRFQRKLEAIKNSDFSAESKAKKLDELGKDAERWLTVNQNVVPTPEIVRVIDQTLSEINDLNFRYTLAYLLEDAARISGQLLDMSNPASRTPQAIKRLTDDVEALQNQVAAMRDMETQGLPDDAELVHYIQKSLDHLDRVIGEARQALPQVANPAPLPQAAAAVGQARGESHDLPLLGELSNLLEAAVELNGRALNIAKARRDIGIDAEKLQTDLAHLRVHAEQTKQTALTKHDPQYPNIVASQQAALARLNAQAQQIATSRDNLAEGATRLQDDFVKLGAKAERMKRDAQILQADNAIDPVNKVLVDSVIDKIEAQLARNRQPQRPR